MAHDKKLAAPIVHGTADDTTGYETRIRIYKALFDGPDAVANEKKLADALVAFDPNDPGSGAAARAVLVELNGNEPTDFGNDEQLDNLKKIFTATRETSPVNTTLGDASRRLWRAMVFGPTENTEVLSRLLHEFAAAKTRLERHLDMMVPNYTWSDDQVADLVQVSVRDGSFANLEWWGAVHDMW